jgi:hypothetical protein
MPPGGVMSGSPGGSGLLPSLAPGGSPARGGSGGLVSPVDQLFAAASLLGAPGSGGFGLAGEAGCTADTDGCCPSSLLAAAPALGSPAGSGSPLGAPAGAPAADEAPRKLAVLGLPWETSEDTLRLHFSQYGVVEAAEIMKDRFTGKSRGFGFVTFVDPAAAARALAADHAIDGRRCEAKVALPKALLLHGGGGDGGAGAAAGPGGVRTTRIFVARIPAAVSESQFRGYFEKFGRLQDAYMPKDHSKQAYRGIGFVTFASPESVERVLSTKHWCAAPPPPAARGRGEGDAAAWGGVA